MAARRRGAGERVRAVVVEMAATGQTGMGFPEEYGGGGDIGPSIATKYAVRRRQFEATSTPRRSCCSRVSGVGRTAASSLSRAAYSTDIERVRWRGPRSVSLSVPRSRAA